MGTKTIVLSNASIEVQREILKKDSQLTVTGTEELIRAIDIKTDKWTALAHAHVGRATFAIKEIVVATETAIIESTPKTAKVASQYICDNVWNWS